jgi:hypothetical protein
MVGYDIHAYCDSRLLEKHALKISHILNLLAFCNVCYHTIIVLYICLKLVHYLRNWTVLTFGGGRSLVQFTT